MGFPFDDGARYIIVVIHLEEKLSFKNEDDKGCFLVTTESKSESVF